MGKPGNTGIIRIIRATQYSAQGLAKAWKYESAFRQELTATVVLVPVSFWLGQTVAERALLIGACVMVLMVELLNSGIEATVDRHGQEMHELSGRAKDMGSAAVMLSLLLWLLVWGTVAWERFAPLTSG